MSYKTGVSRAYSKFSEIDLHLFLDPCFPVRSSLQIAPYLAIDKCFLKQLPADTTLQQNISSSDIDQAKRWWCER